MRKKKKTLIQKKAEGAIKPKGNSKYARKIAMKRKNKYPEHSPITLEG